MSFQQGLSGLNATAQNLNIIGNNIANASTYGSKTSRAEFSDVYAAALNGAGSQAIGIGTTLSSVALGRNAVASSPVVIGKVTRRPAKRPRMACSSASARSP